MQLRTAFCPNSCHFRKAAEQISPLLGITSSVFTGPCRDCFYHVHSVLALTFRFTRGPDDSKRRLASRARNARTLHAVVRLFPWLHMEEASVVVTPYSRDPIR